uniref:Uncharacterized protein n=1 Tax=Panagrolaimus sp. JU765 TaxID=591449 RepID=A0AC34RMN6_9BILA
MTDQEDLTWFHPVFINDCDVGWGYNGNNGNLIPAASVDESNKVIYAIKKTKTHSFAFDLESEDFHKIPCNIFTLPCHFLDSIVKKNQNVYKFMDFLIENHVLVGYMSLIECFSKEIRAEDVCNLPPKTTHFIKAVNYGLQMVIIFNKANIQLFDGDNDGKFLEKIWKKEQEMTDEQKKVECSVLVFSLDATKTNVFKMSMKEIFKFIEEYQNGSHREHERLLYYALKKISVNSEISENFLADTRFDLLTNSIFELYRFKRILEIVILLSKLIQDESLEIAEKKKRKLDSCYIKIKNMWDQGIRRCSELLAGGLTLTESDLSAEFSSDQYEKEIDGLEMNETEDQKIVMNKSDFHHLDWNVSQLLKMDVILSNDTLQPFVKTQGSNERVLLGFGSHQNRTKPKTTETSEMFVSPCPLECSIDDRQWICINCGEFFKTQGFQVVCSCGTTHVTNLKLECFDRKHPKEFFPCEKHDPTSASSIESSRSSFSIVDDGMQ